MQQKIRTLHVYLEEEPLEEPEIMDSDDDHPQPTRHVVLGIFCAMILCLLCIAVPVSSLLLSQRYQNVYDTSITKTITLTLSRHPAQGQLPLYALPAVTVKQQVTVTATGSVHQDASNATGLITFYNGAFTTQTVKAGTRITDKDGISIVTGQEAVIPPATATTPPTYGTVSVTATASSAGEAGNIAAHDMDQACCGTSILAQNLYAFSGGKDARDSTVLTGNDIDSGKQALSAQADNAVNDRIRQEVKPGNTLLPLDCTTTFSASHKAGDQVSSSLLALAKDCTPLAYSTADIERLARQSIVLPQGYRLFSFSAMVMQTHVTAQGGSLAVRTIAYLKHNAIVPGYRFAGK